MSSQKIYDQERYRKTYSFFRARPRPNGIVNLDGNIVVPKPENPADNGKFLTANNGNSDWEFAKYVNRDGDLVYFTPDGESTGSLNLFLPAGDRIYTQNISGLTNTIGGDLTLESGRWSGSPGTVYTKSSGSYQVVIDGNTLLNLTASLTTPPSNNYVLAWDSANNCNYYTDLENLGAGGGSLELTLVTGSFTNGTNINVSAGDAIAGVDLLLTGTTSITSSIDGTDRLTISNTQSNFSYGSAKITLRDKTDNPAVSAVYFAETPNSGNSALFGNNSYTYLNGSTFTRISVANSIKILVESTKISILDDFIVQPAATRRFEVDEIQSEFNYGSNGGWILRDSTGNSAYGAIYSQGITPSSNNYTLSSNGSTTILNGVVISSLYVNGDEKLTVDETTTVVNNSILTSDSTNGNLRYTGPGEALTLPDSGSTGQTTGDTPIDLTDISIITANNTITRAAYTLYGSDSSNDVVMFEKRIIAKNNAGTATILNDIDITSIDEIGVGGFAINISGSNILVPEFTGRLATTIDIKFEVQFDSESI
jgi:hypothetical protein